MRVIWTPEAELDRLTIFQFIAAEDHSAAIRMDQLFGRAAERLGKLPRIGRPGLIEGTREFIPHPSYRLVYEIFEGEVWVLALVHTARLWPPAVRDRTDPS